MKTLKLTLAALTLMGLGATAAQAQTAPMAGAPMGSTTAAPMAGDTSAMSGDKMGSMPMKKSMSHKTHKKAGKSAMAPATGDTMSSMGH